MFSMMPVIGTFTFSNMAMPLRTTPSDASCGVVTMTPPSNGTVWHSESWAAPVPGGFAPAALAAGHRQDASTAVGTERAPYAMPDAHWGYGFPIGRVHMHQRHAG